MILESCFISFSLNDSQSLQGPLYPSLPPSFFLFLFTHSSLQSHLSRHRKLSIHFWPGTSYKKNTPCQERLHIEFPESVTFIGILFILCCQRPPSAFSKYSRSGGLQMVALESTGNGNITTKSFFCTIDKWINDVSNGQNVILLLSCLFLMLFMGWIGRGSILQGHGVSLNILLGRVIKWRSARQNSGFLISRHPSGIPLHQSLWDLFCLCSVGGSSAESPPPLLTLLIYAALVVTEEVRCSLFREVLEYVSGDAGRLWETVDLLLLGWGQSSPWMTGLRPVTYHWVLE